MDYKNKIISVCKFTKIHKLLKPFLAGKGTILAFHRISLNKCEKQRIPTCAKLEVSTDLLESMIQYLIQSGYQFLSLDEVYDRVVNGFESSGKRFVSFTFDDGYLDNYTLAYPILKRYKIPMTIYLTTSFPDRETTLWWYKLEDMILNSGTIEFEYNKRGYAFHAGTLKEKEISYNDIHKLIFNTPQEELENLYACVFDNYEFKRDYMSLLMSWEDVKNISFDPLVTIGAHSVNHYNLRKLTPSDLEYELRTSKERIEEKIGRNVDHFAYPFGSKSTAGRREFEAAASTSFKMATTTRGGNIFPRHKEHLYCLPRISVTWEDFHYIDCDKF